MGPSGGGKSTITKLIAGFWDVTDGAVKLDGTDIRKIPLSQLMDQIAYISQDNYLLMKRFWKISVWESLLQQMRKCIRQPEIVDVMILF